MPWVRSGYRVVERDDEQGTLTLQPEPNARCTFPLRSCTVAIREEEEQQTICGRTAGWGRVLIDEEVFGYHEMVEYYMPYEQQIDPALTTRWTAPAAWIDLPMRVRSTGQLVGWSVVAALPLRVLCSFTDIVPAYDAISTGSTSLMRILAATASRIGSMRTLNTSCRSPTTLRWITSPARSSKR